MQVMPKRMQAMKLRDELNRAGTAADLVDLEGLIDSSLSYPENHRLIMSRFKRVDNKAKKSKATHLGGGGNIDLSYAALFHAARSPQARQTDDATRARRTYSEKEIARKPGLLDRWFKWPMRSDIQDIDAHGSSKSRPIRRKVKHHKKH